MGGGGAENGYPTTDLQNFSSKTITVPKKLIIILTQQPKGVVKQYINNKGRKEEGRAGTEQWFRNLRRIRPMTTCSNDRQAESNP